MDTDLNMITASKKIQYKGIHVQVRATVLLQQWLSSWYGIKPWGMDDHNLFLFFFKWSNINPYILFLLYAFTICFLTRV